MNGRQRNFLVVWGLTFVVVTLFPPWVFIVRGAKLRTGEVQRDWPEARKDAGYGPIWSPPRADVALLPPEPDSSSPSKSGDYFDRLLKEDRQKYARLEKFEQTGRIDVARLMIQWAALIAVGAVSHLMLATKHGRGAETR